MNDHKQRLVGWRIIRLRYIVILVVIFVAATLVVDYRGPQFVPLHTDTAFGMPCRRASDLLVQGFDEAGNLWATRGMLVYRMRKGENRFSRVDHVPTGLSFFWLRNFSVVRKLTRRPECVEMVADENERITALSAGYMWYRDIDEDRGFERSMKLRYYGFGDQGIFPTGIVKVNDSTVIFGEYFRNNERREVSLYRSANHGKDWSTLKSFAPGEIRHVHAIQKDNFTNLLWLCVGDDGKEPMLAWTPDEFRTMHSVGKGSQTWRITQLAFTDSAVFWGADTDHKEAGIYYWHYGKKELKRLHDVDGAIFHATRLQGGTIVMSTDREGFGNELDDRTRFYVIMPGNKVSVLMGGTWRSKEKGFLFRYAKLRFARNQSGSELVFSVLNQTEFPDSELIIIDEKEIVKKAKAVSFP
jgi:hypothetical protein